MVVYNVDNLYIKLIMEGILMSVQQNLDIIQAALDTGENVVITGNAGIGKTFLLEALEDKLKKDGKKIIKCLAGESCTVIEEQKYLEIPKEQDKLIEIISKEDDVIILIDELNNSLYDAEISLYAKPTTKIVATTQDFDDLVKRGLDKYFNRVIKLMK